MNIAGGTYTLNSGDEAITGDTITITGGNFDITTVGKGVKATTDMNISGGEFTINSTDDSVHSNGNITVVGGSFTISSGDDGIHARRKSLYGASFPQMKKCNVTAGNEIPLYRFLKSGPGGGEIKWYFTKFVVDRDGKVVRRFQPDEVYDPADSMDALEQYIKSLLDAPVPETEKPSPEAPAQTQASS